MTEKKQWKRPQDVVTFHTSDPKEMLGKYLPTSVMKTWYEDFTDEDTGETVRRSSSLYKRATFMTWR